MLLKRGDNNEQVKQLQIKLGLEPIGNFGPKTEEAVKAFQSKNGLTADGIVGDGTWNKIMGESAPNPQPAAPIVSVGGLKLDALKGHVPDAVIAMIPDTAAKFQINTPLRLAHFLAQCGHESGGFRVTSENLNYSAKGLNGIFKKYFPTEASAASYARQPQKIANKVYANRMSNGDEASGDGFKFRGRGYIQLTGKANYAAASKAIGEDLVQNPDLVNDPIVGARVVAWYAKTRGLAKLQGADPEAIQMAATKAVAGAGLDFTKGIGKEIYEKGQTGTLMAASYQTPSTTRQAAPLQSGTTQLAQNQMQAPVVLAANMGGGGGAPAAGPTQTAIPVPIRPRSQDDMLQIGRAHV